MAINKHDDYEALARLLYPSIEASGNVYYGQTRKLTLDEVLKRNSLGFDSHIESFYNDDHGYYDSYFCWRLGSLHGSILVDPFVDSVTVDNFSVDFIKRILYADSEEIIYDDNLIYKSSQADPDEDYTLDTSTIPIFGTIFAKYRLDKRSTTITNELNSGSYDSYEVDVEPVLDGIYVTDDFNPVNSIDDDISERHFYISRENGIDYLYIQILTSRDTSRILTFTALEESEISLSMGQPSSGSRVVEYRVSQGGVFQDNWEQYHYDWEEAAAPTGSISITRGCKVQFKSDIENAALFNNTDDCLKFVVNSGTVFVSGSCMSMCHPGIDESAITSLDDYALYGLFSGIENMYGTPVLPNVRELGIGCYNSMFSNCTSLTVAPKLKSDITYNADHIDNSYCYSNMFNGCVSLVSPPKMIGYDTDQYYHSGQGTCHSMFIGCTSLKFSPVIRYKTLDTYGCFKMFNGCSSLKIIQCGAKYTVGSATTLWVSDVSSNGIFIKSSANYSSGANGIPVGWAVVTKDDEYFTVHKDPETGFRIDKHIPSDHYKNDYLVTSGTDSETNGRGYINNYVDTIGKMERSFDENKTHKMNTYNPDGSFNQEIWGYKTFNSPVQFRNGLYGEDWSIYTFDYSNNLQVNEKSTVISRDTDTSASMQIYRQSGYMVGVTNSVILSSSQPSLTYSSDEITATIEVKSTGDQYGNVNESSIKLQSSNQSYISMYSNSNESNSNIELHSDQSYISIHSDNITILNSNSQTSDQSYISLSSNEVIISPNLQVSTIHFNSVYDNHNNSVLEIGNNSVRLLGNTAVSGNLILAPTPKSLYDYREEQIAYIRDEYVDFKFNNEYAGGTIVIDGTPEIVYFTLGYSRTSSSHEVALAQLIVKCDTNYVYSFYRMNQPNNYSIVPINLVGSSNILIPSGYNNVNRRAIFCTGSDGQLIKIFCFNQSSNISSTITSLSNTYLKINNNSYAFSKICLFNCSDNRLLVVCRASTPTEDDTIWLCDSKININGDFAEYTVSGTKINVTPQNLSFPRSVLDAKLISSNKLYITFKEEHFYESIILEYTNSDWDVIRRSDKHSSAPAYNEQYIPPSYSSIQTYSTAKSYANVISNDRRTVRIYIPGGFYYLHPSPKMSLDTNQYQFITYISQICEASEYGNNHMLS